MGRIVPARGGRKDGIAARSSFADQKRWISNEFYQALNEFMVMEDGSRMTKIQGAVRSVVDSLTDPEADPYYRLAALKFVTEHLEGKASAMREEASDEMPRLVIAVGDDAAEQIKEAARGMSGGDPVVAEISDGDGSNRQEVLA